MLMDLFPLLSPIVEPDTVVIVVDFTMQNYNMKFKPNLKVPVETLLNDSGNEIKIKGKHKLTLTPKKKASIIITHAICLRVKLVRNVVVEWYIETNKKLLKHSSTKVTGRRKSHRPLCFNIYTCCKYLEFCMDGDSLCRMYNYVHSLYIVCEKPITSVRKSKVGTDFDIPMIFNNQSIMLFDIDA